MDGSGDLRDVEAVTLSEAARARARDRKRAVRMVVDNAGVRRILLERRARRREPSQGDAESRTP